MSREISRAEAWERAHEIYSQVNFNAFDFASIKESLLDYTKLYYPEDFNDYIESSEFIALLELFAYVGELLAYRLDLNAHENFITTAQRKESVLRLAKMLSYKASRNIPARGLVKITSVQTSEVIYDSAGRNLSGRRIYWNDVNNVDWKEQFILVMNRILEQEFGTVEPNDRAQVDDVLFELYTFNNNPISANGRSVLAYSAVTGTGNSVPLELVPSKLDENGPSERRPELNAKFSILYANDGLGDGSNTTGFMMFTKQGTLAFQTQQFDGVTPNQTFDLSADNINETDVWLNNVNPDTGEILINDPYAAILPHLVSEDLLYGEWVEVDVANAQNIIFNTNKNRHKYEIETLDNDRVRIIFGDGEFSDIPSGTFHIWYRTSANEDLFIERSSVIDKSASFSYTDSNGSIQTLSVTFSLISSLQNASASEDIEHIRRVAPSVYYTQDRMVNGRDYNTFMLQDPSILRLRAINRTFAGDSKYIAWHDPRNNYEDVKVFGDDLALYWTEASPESGALISISDALTSEQLLDNYIEPLLSSTDFFSIIGSNLQQLNIDPSTIRRTFNTSTTPYAVVPDPATGQTNERDAILYALDLAATTSSIVYLYYSILYDEWVVGASPELGGAHPCVGSPLPLECNLGAADSLYMFKIEAQFQGSSLSGWDIRWSTKRLIAHSDETQFWNTNSTLNVVNFDTLESRLDRLMVLAANVDANGTGIIGENKTYTVLGQELVEQNLPNSGLPDPNSLSVMPVDVNDDGIPDNLLQPQLFDGTYTYKWTGTEPSTTGSPSYKYINVHELFGQKYNVSSISSTKGLDNDVEVYVDGVRVTFASGEIFPTEDPTSLVSQTIAFLNEPSGSPEPVITLIFKSYVYFSREDTISEWAPVNTTDTIRTLYMTENAATPEHALYRRNHGRYPLNFLWLHNTPRLNLVDPAASNIIDIFIITVGYYNALRAWLSNRTSIKPTPPTPLELRTSYADLLDSRMISDTVVLHPGKFKILFGSRAIPQLRCKFKVIRPRFSSLTDNQVKVRIVSAIRAFFDLDSWEFGETWYFTEMAAAIHADLGPEIDSIVLVPTYSQNQFGDMFQIMSREDELFIPDINTSDIEIIESMTPVNIRQEP